LNDYFCGPDFYATQTVLGKRHASSELESSDRVCVFFASLKLSLYFLIEQIRSNVAEASATRFRSSAAITAVLSRHCGYGWLPCDVQSNHQSSQQPPFSCFSCTHARSIFSDLFEKC
jgi:hypothetical protein